MHRLLLVLCWIKVCCGSVWAEAPAQAGTPGKSLLENGNFENGTAGWNAIWAREAGTAKAVLDTTERHSGTQSLRLELTGQKDWSLTHSLNLKVQPGAIYELTAWVRIQGTGSATLGVIARDADGQVATAIEISPLFADSREELASKVDRNLTIGAGQAFYLGSRGQIGGGRGK